MSEQRESSTDLFMALATLIGSSVEWIGLGLWLSKVRKKLALRSFEKIESKCMKAWDVR